MRNSIKTLTAIAALALAGAASTAGAAVIYDNGPLNGTVEGWTLNYGYAVEDSFTVSSAATATGADFVTWAFPGDSLLSVDWVIEPTQTFGDSGTATVTSTFLFTNPYGYDIYANHISFAGVALTPGTYYFGLQNAVVPSGDPIYWDQNDGPSAGYENAEGSIGSETFDITSSVPEPASWALMLVGFGGIGAAMRSRRRVAAAVA